MPAGVELVWLICCFNGLHVCVFVFLWTLSLYLARLEWELFQVLFGGNRVSLLFVSFCLFFLKSCREKKKLHSSWDVYCFWKGVRQNQNIYCPSTGL